MISNLQNNFLNILKLTNQEYKRYIHNFVDFNDKLIGIIGPRGAGKSTFLLQYLQEVDIQFSKKLYFSADHIDVANYSLYEIAKEFAKRGGKLLVIDEIHKYNNFEKELKSIYDYLDLQVIFSGSSALQLENAKIDLSRRAVIYKVNGLSFREFCELQSGKSFDTYSLEDILNNHIDIVFEINNKIKPYEYFENYLKYGFYPFYKENIDTYPIKLSQTINLVLESDLTQVFNIEPKNVFKLKKLVSLICSSKPYELNITKLSTKIEINRNTLYKYLHYLELGSIIKMIKSNAKGDGILVKPEKVYLHNPNLANTYCSNSDIGAIRELFFANQLSLLHKIDYPKVGDFFVDDRYTFEIGGKDKSFKQIKDIENSFVVSDDIEIGFGNKIPLWLFGFLY